MPVAPQHRTNLARALGGALVAAAAGSGCTASPSRSAESPSEPPPAPKAAAPAPTPPPREPQLAIGGCHGCVVDGQGQLACWGCNDHGQLGDGTFEHRATPGPVSGLDRVDRVALGWRGTCAIDQEGAVWCWGAPVPETRSGKPAESSRPVRIDEVEDAVEVSVGGSTACARTRGGEVRCWGKHNYRHFAGSGRSAVERVDDDLGVRARAVRVDGSDDACVLAVDGRVLCWGADLGEWNPPPLPAGATAEERHRQFLTWGGPRVATTGASGFVAGSAAICVWIGEGATRQRRCLDKDTEGKRTTVHAEADAAGAAAQVATSWEHGCAAAGGRVRCWGEDRHGQVGVDAVGRLTDVVRVATGPDFTCALRQTGAVACWGNGDRLATGDATMTLTPDPPAPGEVRPRLLAIQGVKDLSQGSCAIEKDGRVKCLKGGRWRRIAGLRDVAELAVGEHHMCARTGTGAVYCWGEYYFGPTNHDAMPSDWLRVRKPRRIAGLTARAIESWGDNDCAVATDGTVWCWGQWGEESLKPVRQDGFTDAVDLACTTWWFCVRRADGTASCSNNNVVRREPPVELEGVAAVAVADFRGCAVHDSGRVTCWGGQLTADASLRAGQAPAEVPGIEDAAAISVGGHVCTLSRDGTILCWGENDDGQLGDGTLRARPTPTKVELALPNGGRVVGVAALGSSTAAWTDAGEAWAWGEPW